MESANMDLSRTLSQEPLSSPGSSLGALDFSSVTCQHGSPRVGDAPSESDVGLKGFMDRYGVVSLLKYDPFLVLGCRPSIPDASDRPLTVEGWVAVWRDENDMEDFRRSFCPTIGDEGNDEPVYNDVPMYESEQENIVKWKMLRMDILSLFSDGGLPGDDFFVFLAIDVFKDCVALSWIDHVLVVELSHTDDPTFKERLNHLPQWIVGLPYAFQFHNGPLQSTGADCAQEVRPPPQTDDEEEAGQKTSRYSDDFTLIPIKNVNLLDGFQLCSSATGKQRVKMMGARCQIGRGDENVAYIYSKQLICATNDPTIYSSLRDHDVAAVLLRCTDGESPGQLEEEVLERGELCGIVLFRDLPAVRGTLQAKDYLIFAEVFDPLIEEDELGHGPELDGPVDW